MAEYFPVLFLFALLILFSKRRGLYSSSKKRLSEFGKISETLKGDRVRSKGEKIIADWLYQHQIKYKYELKLSSFVPDFFLTEYKMIIEYYGLRDVLGRTGVEYRKKIDEKREYFSNLSVRFLELYQEDLSHLDTIIPLFLLKNKRVKGKRPLS